MMCLGDRSTFTSTSALSDRSTFTLISTLSGRHDGSSPLFLEGLVVYLGVSVFARAQAFSPPIFSNKNLGLLKTIQWVFPILPSSLQLSFPNENIDLQNSS